jgi:hypothetical protein
LHSTNRSDGRRRRRKGNYTPQKYQSNRGLRGNEKNGYPVPDPQKTMIIVTNAPSHATKNPSERKS